jgi:ribosome-binding factor A
MKSGQSGKMKNRLTEDVRRVLANIIANDMHDPIFSELITIKDVKSVRGGHVIFVYFTVGFSNSEKDKKNAEKVKERLEKSAGFIGGKICRALSLRRSPEL